MKKTTEQFKKELEDKFGDKLDYSKIEYVNNNIKIKLICKKHNFEYLVLPRNLISSNTTKCPKCASESKAELNKKQRKNTEWFIEKAKEKWNDKFDYGYTNYINAKTKVKIKCNICGNIFEILPRYHFRKDGGCSICAHRKVNLLKRISQEEIINKCKERKEYDCSKIVYKGCNKKIEIICKKHGSFWILPYNFYGNKQGCPYCKSSTLEKEVRDYLIKNNIEFESQKTFNDLRDKRKLSYDFFIPSKNTLIECQGIQHYEPVDLFGGEEAFKKQKKHDRLKKEYAKKNGYKLIEISYLKKIIL